MNATNDLIAGVLVWVSVDQYLPDDDETVLVYSPTAEGEPVWPAWLDAGVWRYTDGVEAHGVTHWLPMPDGPSVLPNGTTARPVGQS